MGQGCPGEVREQPPTPLRTRRHLLTFVPHPRGEQHTQALALVGQGCSSLIPARSGRFSGEGTFPPSPVSQAGTAGPAPPRKPPRLFLCQALSPETTRPEVLTGGAAMAAGAGGFPPG